MAQVLSAMRVEDHFRSLTSEVDSLSDRVRHLIEGRHWQTDGEWKESVIRQVLRRHLPESVRVGRGFVVTAASASHQLDVLITDGTKPVLFKDGDLSFVTPDAVLGIIEVKSRVTPNVVAQAARKLAAVMLVVRLHRGADRRAFAGLFAFEGDGAGSDAYLASVAGAAQRWESRLDFVCVGTDWFIRYWHFNPRNPQQQYEGWHAYRLPGTAPGYFVHNVIDSISPESVFSNSEVWFPGGGKEQYREGAVKGRWVPTT